MRLKKQLVLHKQEDSEASRAEFSDNQTMLPHSLPYSKPGSIPSGIPQIVNPNFYNTHQVINDYAND